MFKSKGFEGLPKRCTHCRRRRRQERDLRMAHDMDQLRQPSRAWGGL